MGADVRARFKLLGTLPSYFAGSYSAAGIEVNLPDNATVAAVVEIERAGGIISRLESYKSSLPQD
jgi:hypothetical protein